MTNQPGTWAALMRELRVDAGLTQEELADRSGLSVRTVRNLELGRTRPRGATARRIDSILGVDAAGSPVPAQLPPRVRRFVGRASALAELDTAVQEANLAVVSGTAGVGKTALVVHWAHGMAGRFRDGQLYLDLRGFHPDPPMPPAEAARFLLTALGVPQERIPGRPDERTALLRTVTASARLLVVLDNAADAGQVRPLLPSGPGSFVVVTSRNRMRGLVAVDGGWPQELGLLDLESARELVIARLGRARTAAEPAAVDAIIERCARLPLALVIATARAATRPGVPLTEVAAELTGGTLDPFDAGDATADLRAVFSWSYRRLGPDAAELFRAFGPGPAALLDELAGAHLIEETAPGRYSMHELLRTYASELSSY